MLGGGRGPDSHSPESPLRGVSSSISSPSLLRRGCVGTMGCVGSLLQELRARPSPAPPQLSKLVWGHVSW